MKSHITIARIRGIELGLHLSWILIALLIVFSLAERFSYIHRDWVPAVIWGAAIITGLLFFVGLFIHELSHAMVAKARGLPIRRITLFLLGGVAQIEREPQRPGTEFWMAIAGPAASVAVGFLCLAVAWAVFGWPWWTEAATPPQAVLVWLGYINLILAGFNLIPGFPMDGGRILRAIVWSATGSSQRATTIAARIGSLIGWLFVVWGLWRALSGAGLGGLWIALIGWFLIQASGSALAHSRAESLLRGLSVRDIMSRDCVRVDANASVESFVQTELLRAPSRCYVVVEGDQFAGLVLPSDTRRVARERWNQTPVRAIMRPLSRLKTLSPDADATEALDMMGRENLAQVPVISNGFFQGVVSRNHLAQVMATRSELKAA